MRISQNSLSSRVISFLLLSALTAGVASAPVCVWAQEQAPAAASQGVAATHTGQGQDALPAQPGQVKKEEAEEANVYRHTPLVHSLARIFHMDVETTARLFEYINFAIIMLAIVIPLAKVLPKVMRRRNQTLSHNLESARKMTADANTRLSAVEAQLSRLDDEIGKIRAQVEEESKQDEARIKASIEEERARIVASAEQEITAAAAHAQRGLRHFAADLAIEQAAKQLILTPEIDRALISEFVKDAGSNGKSSGGQN